MFCSRVRNRVSLDLELLCVYQNLPYVENSLFTNETFFTEVARSFPGVIKGSAGSLEKLRKGLLKAYRTFRRGLDAQQDFPAKVVVRAYDRAAEGFRRAASRATPEELVLTPRYVPVVEQSEKEGEEKEISR